VLWGCGVGSDGVHLGSISGRTRADAHADGDLDDSEITRPALNRVPKQTSIDGIDGAGFARAARHPGCPVGAAEAGSARRTLGDL
jgi:hypothetical protein